ncbi:MAG TPA: glycosyltransferase family 2 protein [Edaphocola sp.]|nr:glycosyltransferase family 2 protein [Edaphocola sp.]
MNISVVIPMYNAATTIVATVESCLNQSLKPTEIIIVDDASTDNCREIVLQTFSNTVQLIALESNRGPSFARNKGWDIAQGDYVAFVDSDDEWHPQKLEIFSKILEQKQTINFWFHQYATQLSQNAIPLDKQPKSTAVDFKKLLVKNPVSSSAIIFKRTLPIRFDPTMRYCEDYDLALRTVYQYGAYYSPLILTKIGRPVLSKGGASAQKWKMRKGEIKSYFKLGQLNSGFYFLFPLQLLWSMIKHLKTIISLSK